MSRKVIKILYVQYNPYKHSGRWKDVLDTKV